MSDSDLEEEYQEHLRLEGESELNIHPDGCWYCGGEHPSNSCPNRRYTTPCEYAYSKDAASATGMYDRY